jgi:hypothetical protein
VLPRGCLSQGDGSVHVDVGGRLGLRFVGGSRLVPRIGGTIVVSWMFALFLLYGEWLDRLWIDICDGRVELIGSIYPDES